jgi:hypothetical protein
MANVEESSIAQPADMATLVRKTVSELRRLWEEGVDSGRSAALDMAAIKQRGRQRLQASRK